MTYNQTIVMQAAHEAARKMSKAGRWDGVPYREVLTFYLKQKWVVEQHRIRAARCTGATVTVAKAFDNNNSPIWSLRV
jgi:hypothetical protein